MHLRDTEPLAVFRGVEVAIDRPIFEMPEEIQVELAERLLALSITAGLIEQITSEEVDLKDVILVERVIKKGECDGFGSSYRTDAFYASDFGHADSLAVVEAYYGGLEKRLAGDGVGVALEQKNSRTVFE